MKFDPVIINAVLIALSVIIVDTLLGIFRAIGKGELDVRRLPAFLQTAVLPYVGSLIVLAVFALWVAEIKVLLLASAGFITAKYLAEIKDKLISIGVSEVK